MSLLDDVVRAQREKLNHELEQRIREAGPGHAVGWRVKAAVSVPERPRKRGHSSIEYEFHTVPIIDGHVTGLAGFLYATLKEWA